MQTPLKIPSLRRFLLSVHKDLLSIHRAIGLTDTYSRLSALELMTLAMEDRRFFEHQGFDSWSFGREIFRMITLQRFGGASTIDMQFVRTITGYRQRTAMRKLYEILLAVLIQFRYGKIEILRAYLSNAYFGSHLIGSDAASFALYRKSAWELDQREAAVVASMLVYPKPLAPTDGWRGRVKRRAEYALIVCPIVKKRLEKLPIRKLL